MKVGEGFRYALEYRDPVKGWTLRMSGDDRATVFKLYSTQERRDEWRIKDRATDTVITEAA